jgi:hypothetical protein
LTFKVLRGVISHKIELFITKAERTSNPIFYLRYLWKANGKTTTLQLFLDSLSPKNMRDASSGDKLKIALFGDLSLEEAMDLS